ncbi:tRNA lysidine(34) synthetase TilS [Clostridium thermarum]|uniref:tRNA lysidine(34) synthetase TilS n=1 Tax=Clostridium thermarum TaxID=1716543 RepID=UPI0013D70087|nr:tRNA lysidine(34) synthetase TilS [Clostridium thermarum]
MLQKVIDFINKYSMLNKGDRVIVALSGGPDSVCLMHMLNEVKEIYDIEIYGAHVNHCLRGEEADEDEAYAERFCRSLGVEFYSKKVDINEMVKRLNLSSETAGREARYSFFNELKERLGANKIALAHNLNDQAETVLMRIMRGAGIEGLQGIKPVRDGIFIRPILVLKREEIESYCAFNQLNPRTDKTNFENIYNRNKVRLELIPYIEKNFNKDILNTLNRLANIVSKDNEYIDEAAGKKYKTYCSFENNTVTLNKRLAEEHEAIISRVIRKALYEINGSLVNIEMIHIGDIIDLFTIGTGKKVALPSGVQAENVYGDIRIYKVNETVQDKTFDGSIVLLAKNDISREILFSRYIEEMDITVGIRLVKKHEIIKFAEDPYKKYFDYDKIINSISIRYRRQGDRFSPYGMKGSKKIKDLFMDLKIPKDERDNIPLLCFDEEIVWVVGYNVSNNYIVTKNTKNILEIKIKKGETK